MHLHTASIYAVVSSLMLTGAVQAAIYTTGFEASEGYTEGDVIGQEGWSAPFNTATGMEVTTPEAGEPAVPEGSHYLRIVRGAGDTRAAQQLADEPLTDPFTVSVVLAYDDLAATSLPTVYISNAANSFNGVIFGFQESDGAVNLVYRNSNTFVSLGEALPNQFYRFDAHVDPATATYDIVVSNLEGAEINSAQDAFSRGGVSEFSHLAVNVLNASGTLFVDDLTVVPEPAAAAWLGAAAVLGLCRRRTRPL